MSFLDEGFWTPSTGSLYPPPPYRVNGAYALIGRFEVDSAKAVALLPPGVTPFDNPTQCLAWCALYNASNFGRYHEMLFLLRVKLESELRLYCPFIYVDSDAAMACGREVLGFPKKMADMAFEATNGPVLFSLDRPAGRPLLKASFTRERMARMADMDMQRVITVRRIPPSGSSGISPVCELLQMSSTMRPDLRGDGVEDVWSGAFDLKIEGQWQDDPLHILAPTKLLGGYEVKYDTELFGAKRVFDYTASAQDVPVERAATGGRQLVPQGTAS
jgi:acetoacetate decarboxylase